jgi:hypothetical protein
MPHVTTFRFSTLRGKRDEVVSLVDEWANAEQSNAPRIQEHSLIASNDDPAECMAYVRFDTTENSNGRHRMLGSSGFVSF